MLGLSVIVGLLVAIVGLPRLVIYLTDSNSIRKEDEAPERNEANDAYLLPEPTERLISTPVELLPQNFVDNGEACSRTGMWMGICLLPFFLGLLIKLFGPVLYVFFSMIFVIGAANGWLLFPPNYSRFEELGSLCLVGGAVFAVVGLVALGLSKVLK